MSQKNKYEIKSIRFTAEDRANLECHAAAESISVSAYIRKALLAYYNPSTVQPINERDRAYALKDMVAIKNLLASSNVSNDVRIEVERRLTNIWDTFR